MVTVISERMTGQLVKKHTCPIGQAHLYPTPKPPASFDSRHIPCKDQRSQFKDQKIKSNIKLQTWQSAFAHGLSMFIARHLDCSGPEIRDWRSKIRLRDMFQRAVKAMNEFREWSLTDSSFPNKKPNNTCKPDRNVDAKYASHKLQKIKNQITPCWDQRSAPLQLTGLHELVEGGDAHREHVVVLVRPEAVEYLNIWKFESRQK